MKQILEHLKTLGVLISCVSLISCDEPKPDDSVYVECERALRSGEHEIAVTTCDDVYTRFRTSKARLLKAASLLGVDRVDDAHEVYDVVGGAVGAFLRGKNSKTVDSALYKNLKDLELCEKVLRKDESLVGTWTTLGRLHVFRASILDHKIDHERQIELNFVQARVIFDKALALVPHDSRTLQFRRELCAEWDGCD